MKWLEKKVDGTGVSLALPKLQIKAFAMGAESLPICQSPLTQINVLPAVAITTWRDGKQVNIAKPLTVSRMTVTNMPTLSMGDYVLVFVERGSNACLLTALPGSQLMAQVSIIPATTEVASMETESQTQDCVIA